MARKSTALLATAFLLQATATPLETCSDLAALYSDTGCCLNKTAGLPYALHAETDSMRVLTYSFYHKAPKGASLVDAPDLRITSDYDYYYNSVFDAEFQTDLLRSLNASHDTGHTHNAFLAPLSYGVGHGVLNDTLGYDTFTSGVALPFEATPFPPLRLSEHMAYMSGPQQRDSVKGLLASSGYTNVRVVAPCGTMVGESVLWSRLDLTEPQELYGRFRAFGRASTLFGAAFPTLEMYEAPNVVGFREQGENFTEYGSPYMDAYTTGVGMLEYARQATHPLYYYIGAPITHGPWNLALHIPEYIYAAHGSRVEAYCATLNGFVGEQLADDEIALRAFVEAGVLARETPAWLTERLRTAWETELQGYSAEFKARFAAMQNSTWAFTQYL
jgi:hypothetical protein